MKEKPSIHMEVFIGKDRRRRRANADRLAELPERSYATIPPGRHRVVYTETWATTTERKIPLDASMRSDAEIGKSQCIHAIR